MYILKNIGICTGHGAGHSTFGMNLEKSLIVFQGKGIRRLWHNEEWFFSVIDIVGFLTSSTIPRRYWFDLKNKLKDEF